MSYLGPVERLGTTKGFYKNPSRIKDLDELLQQPVPGVSAHKCIFCLYFLQLTPGRMGYGVF